MQLLPGAEPYLQMGDSGVGCVITHGFTATPNEVIWLARHMAAQGHSVYAPRLPAHGTDPHHMNHVNWEAWLGAVLDGYHMLKRQCDQVFVLGMSMGGVLSLLTSTYVPVQGIVAMGTPIQIDWRARWIPIMRYAVPYQMHPDLDDLSERVKQQQRINGELPVGRVRYHKWAMPAVYQLYQLVKTLQHRLPLVTAPLLLISSSRDELAPPKHAELIAGNVSSPVIERHTFHKGGHILTQDYDREAVFEKCADFVKTFSR